MKLSVIVPVYNEEQTIGAVIERIRAVDLGDIEKEIIVANDGSSDGTRRAIDEGPWREDPARAHPAQSDQSRQRRGRPAWPAYATGDVLLTQDADLELNPDEYGNLLAPILAGTAIVVYGSQVSPGAIPPSRFARGSRTACSRC